MSNSELEHYPLPHPKKNIKSLVLLSLAALGVVYGDIGTSPLYAVNEIFFGHSRTPMIQSDEMGAISLIFWALTFVVAFKYVVFVLRADYEKEGGVFALYGLIHKLKSRYTPLVGILLIIAAGLLFGDGIITPAISVISAVEGLKIATPDFAHLVIPITIAILTGLFVIQRFGTEKVGRVFGPIMIIWFLAIALLGLSQIVQFPRVLAAINPYYALSFLVSHPIHTFLLTLGSVMLVITGGEAMYADMGHFGKLPIRFSWFSIVYPALLLNYFGQGAFLLSGKSVFESNIFFSMVPSFALIPMVILATMATIIASQALISGAFSLATQAISLGLLPFTTIIHTSKHHEGQIYVPKINWLLYFGCVALVLIFQSSSRLASAYGLAVSGVMLVTSLGLAMVSYHYWKWSLVKIVPLFGTFILVDLLFLTSNSLKLIEGGYIPLLIGLIILFLMKTWEWGRKIITDKFNSYPSMNMRELIDLKKSSNHFIPKSIVILSPNPILSLDDKIPTLKQIFIERYGMLPEHLMFLTVVRKKVPHVHQESRYEIKNFVADVEGSITSVIMYFGFMEEPNVEAQLDSLASHKEIHLDNDHTKWLIHAMHEKIYPGEFSNIFDSLRFLVFRWLTKTANTADHYFRIGIDVPLSIEVLPVHIGKKE